MSHKRERCKLELLEEILPRIEKYLAEDLAKEKLTQAAEKRRLWYVDRIKEYSAELPPLPDRNPVKERPAAPIPNGLKSDADTKTPTVNHTNLCLAGTVPASQGREDLYDVIMTNVVEYEPIGNERLNGAHTGTSIVKQPTEKVASETAASRNDNMKSDTNKTSTPGYVTLLPESEEPYDEMEKDAYETVGNGPTVGHRLGLHAGRVSDEGGDTDFESYDEEEPRPSKTSGKKKKTEKTQKTVQELFPKLYEKHSKTATCIDVFEIKGGLVIRKGKRLCTLRATTLSCYKTDKDTTPANVFSMPGYNVQYEQIEAKEPTGKPKYELCLQHPSKENYRFCADSPEQGQRWFNALRQVSSASPEQLRSALSPEIKTVNGDCGESIYEEFPCTTEQAESSESGGSVDTAMLQNITNRTTKQQRSATLPKKSQDSSRDKLRRDSETSTPTGTVSKKSSKFKGLGLPVNLSSIGKGLTSISKGLSGGSKVRKPLIYDQDANIAGYIKVSFDFTSLSRTWSSNYCVVKDGVMNCYQSMADSEVERSIPLRGADLSFAKVGGKDSKKQLIRLSEDVCIQLTDHDEYNRWLSVMVEVCGLKTRPQQQQQDSDYSLPSDDAPAPPLPTSPPPADSPRASDSDDDADTYYNDPTARVQESSQELYYNEDNWKRNYNSPPDKSGNEQEQYISMDKNESSKNWTLQAEHETYQNSQDITAATRAVQRQPAGTGNVEWLSLPVIRSQPSRDVNATTRTITNDARQVRELQNVQERKRVQENRKVFEHNS